MDTTTIISSGPALLRLLQLASPTLPVGGYAYSQGMEYAVARGWISDEATAQAWIVGLLRHLLTYLDVPVFARLYQGWMRGDAAAVAYWNAWLYAGREARELQEEDRQLGAALARLLFALGIAEAEAWRSEARVCFATLFALGAARWGIVRDAAAVGYLWAWTENQVAAAIKLVPLGQTAGQRILTTAQPEIIAALAQGLTLADDDLGSSTPALAIASAHHEAQYTRLFRS